MLKSPLRYPGGKQKAIAQIARYLPPQFREFREPFVGGGSVFLHVHQRHPEVSCWINDLNPELYHFWSQVKTNLPQLVEQVWQVKRQTTDGRALFTQLAAIDPRTLSSLERAVRFFVLNRITFSGTIESGGYSAAAFQSRFTDSAIQRLADLKESLVETTVTHSDYSDLLQQPGEQVFIFLDPPYLSKTRSKLYGRKGDLHTGFDHDRFAERMAQCPHQWLITYDDCDQVRQNFAFAQIYEWELQYGMNNYRQANAEKGKELFITNYAVEWQKTVRTIEDDALDMGSDGLILDPSKTKPV
jgi:DNA adenine methylase